MNKSITGEYRPGRCFAASLPHGKDLITSIEEFCAEFSVQMASFSAIGAVSFATLGTYDQKQQVYATYTVEGPFEIISCIGNVSLKEAKPFIHAHVLLSDEQEKCVGGHLFSETTIFASELHLQEFDGKPMERNYDPVTGLMLWSKS